MWLSHLLTLYLHYSTLYDKSRITLQNSVHAHAMKVSEHLPKLIPK